MKKNLQMILEDEKKIKELLSKTKDNLKRDLGEAVSATMKVSYEKMSFTLLAGTLSSELEKDILKVLDEYGFKQN